MYVSNEHFHEIDNYHSDANTCKKMVTLERWRDIQTPSLRQPRRQYHKDRQRPAGGTGQLAVRGEGCWLQHSTAGTRGSGRLWGVPAARATYTTPWKGRWPGPLDDNLPSRSRARAVAPGRSRQPLPPLGSLWSLWLFR